MILTYYTVSRSYLFIDNWFAIKEDAFQKAMEEKKKEDQQEIPDKVMWAFLTVLSLVPILGEYFLLAAIVENINNTFGKEEVQD